MAPLPTPVRAALGLAAVAVEEARTLPDRAVELPVLVVSTALQVSVRIQQRYAELALRGDELLSRLHELPEEPPSWATFDDEESEPEPAADSALSDTREPKPAADSAFSDTGFSDTGEPEPAAGPGPADISEAPPPRHHSDLPPAPNQPEPSPFDNASE